VKIFDPAVPGEDVDAEIEALSRCGHPHTVRLLDVASAPDGRPCLILERLAGGSLSRLVSDRERIGPGEAVTILAPLLAAVEAMHASGVVHGGLRLSSVHFRSSGAPVLLGFGTASLIAPGQSVAALALDPLVGRDREALGALARAVLARVPGEQAALLLESLPEGSGAIDPALLFEFADPAPVRLGTAPPDGQPPVLTARAVAARPVPQARAGPVRRRSARTGPWSLERARAWSADQARQVRPRFWVLGAAVAASVVAALLVVPQSDTPGSAVGSSAGSGNSATPGDSASPANSATPTDSVPPGNSAPPADAALPDDPVLSDDPVAAPGALLAERERCLRDLSVLCLDGVLQNGSAAMERDAAIIRSIQEGGEVPHDAVIAVGTLALVERLGDSALVSLGAPGDAAPGAGPGDSKPASSLVMRGEAGWRIRDYLD
jgi:hypothetical protein